LNALTPSRWIHWWDHPFPKIIKHRLQASWPDAKLLLEDLSIGFQNDVDEGQVIELDLLKRLVSIQNIYSVKLTIEYENPVTMRWLKDMLLSSPNLKILYLTLPECPDGDVDWLSDGLGSYNLCIESGERLPPLDELVYEMRHHRQAVDQPFIPASFFDLTKIRHLTLTGSNVVEFRRQLKGLFFHYLESIIIDCFTEPHLSTLNTTLEDLITRMPRAKTVRIVTTGDLIPIPHFIHLCDTLTNFEL
jgi:hypothetical protein